MRGGQRTPPQWVLLLRDAPCPCMGYKCKWVGRERTWLLSAADCWWWTAPSPTNLPIILVLQHRKVADIAVLLSSSPLFGHPFEGDAPWRALVRYWAVCRGPSCPVKWTAGPGRWQWCEGGHDLSRHGINIVWQCPEPWWSCCTEWTQFLWRSGLQL